MEALKGGEYLLDGYISYEKHLELKRDDTSYNFTYFQLNHEDEYLIKKDKVVSLFHNGILKMNYMEDDDGTREGDFTVFENGRVSFVQSFDEIYDQRNFNRICNHMNGERLEIISHETDKLIYHGEFNAELEREGWGIMYDENTGSMLLEGIWKENKLVEIIRKIEGNFMTEFKRNGNNVSVSSRIPVYVGEFVYDQSKESFIRNGIGYLIDEETRIAYRECEWKDGTEVNGRDLYDGWYTRSKNPVYKPAIAPSKVIVKESKDLSLLDVNSTDLVVSPNCCNSLVDLEWNQFHGLRKISLGDDCFGNVKVFKLNGLSRLRYLTIGRNSFTQNKNHFGNDDSKSFYILNCPELESIKIGEYSFSDFAGGFELKDLPSLQSLSIGTIGRPSSNFYWSSFVIQGRKTV